ncbi:hypothetical protein PTMSG1_07797 [Pyrenophora teres f. maculata]|nr:hypothetical protein PTMSG1_07797 [Pyrenophora teres f. maculata]
MKLLIMLAGLLSVAMAIPTEQNQNENLAALEKRQNPCGVGGCPKGLDCNPDPDFGGCYSPGGGTPPVDPKPNPGPPSPVPRP